MTVVSNRARSATPISTRVHVLFNLAMNQEQMISWWYLHVRSISMRQKVDPRSRSSCQSSRSNMQLCKTIVWAINHKWTNDWILMIFINLISIDGMMFKLIEGQSHKVKGQGNICKFVKKTFFGYKSWTNELMLMVLTHMIDINKILM